MLSTSFNPHIINYESFRGLIVPKFTAYDGTNDSFDHIMHFKQLLTLDIGNDALLCKVFPTSLHNQAFSWFHCLLQNSVNTFRDISEAFMGHYLCSTCHKHNISILRADKYSMFEDDVQPATQHVLVTNRPTKDDEAKSSKSLNQSRQASKRWADQHQYVNTTGGQRDTTQEAVVQTPASLAALEVVINYKHVGLVNERHSSKRQRRIPQTDELLTIRLKEPRAFVIRIQWSYNFSGRRVALVDNLSPYNAIMGHAWLHRMKAILSTYHQMVSYLIEEAQVDLFGSLLVTCQCYQVALDSGHPIGEKTHPESSNIRKQ
uniref:Retrotransposon gag domain-containing protein n=1 Tax=Vitis vinifera TaxID=29760 RepID=A5C419_VITVI|nr:hypothetical protein VITISV_021131 [Vitis vinifera]